ncbi:MAG: arsenic resistance N-acetyltransferase ArsN2 [Gammaproteobacteria bacterium]|nr:arsenic resistance N-acetyltransferase ArsN2 [Gammaproteobacteria bacterium]
MSGDRKIRQGSGSDFPVATRWLSDMGFPSADLTPEHMQQFLVASVDDRPVGMIGLEPFGKTGLLRSLIVARNSRRNGLGKALVDALETRASRLGVTELWLLTIDAERYFLRLGYAIVDRAKAPPEIQATQEYSSLCPGDTVLMRKYL